MVRDEKVKVENMAFFCLKNLMGFVWGTKFIPRSEGVFLNLIRQLLGPQKQTPPT